MASFLALLNNILEIRVDATKLCRVTQRPVWTAAEDIGSWFTVMNVLGFAAVVTNATMITFVGKLLADTEEAALGGLQARFKEWNLWLIAVLVEHSVLIGRVIILSVWPATPGWIETAKKQLVWHQQVSVSIVLPPPQAASISSLRPFVSQTIKSGQEILEELELHSQFKEKYDVSDDDLNPEVERFLLTQNSIRKYMDERGIGPEQKKAQREEKRRKALAKIEKAQKPAMKGPNSATGPRKTSVKITNPLQEPMKDMDLQDDIETE